MKTLLIGANGNMGRRYASILSHLGEDAYLLDLPHSTETFKKFITRSDKIIIATPTNTHMDVLADIEYVRNHEDLPKIDVLCEKPVVKTELELRRIKAFISMNLYCVNQYQYIPTVMLNKNATGNSSYNYYYSGRDGWHWDHFQIYALAKESVQIFDYSPYWMCVINGKILSSADMDGAYVEMIEDFVGLQKFLWGMDVIERTTKRIIEVCEKS